MIIPWIPSFCYPDYIFFAVSADSPTCLACEIAGPQPKLTAGSGVAGCFYWAKNRKEGMDKVPLKTYHLVKPEPHLPTMKSQRFFLSMLVVVSLLPAQSMAATKRRGGTAAPQSGVMLQTPNPSSPIEHNNRGVELGSKGLWKDAIVEHEKALAMQPGNKDFRTNLSSAQLHYGVLLFRQQKYYEAMKEFRGALFVDPDNLPAEESLDECYKKMGKDPGNPGYLAYRRSQAEDFEIKGLYEDAIVEYRRCLKISDSGKSHADLGYVFFKAGKPVEGYAELKIAVQKNWNKDEINEEAQAHRMMAETLYDYAFRAQQDGRGTVGMRRLANAVVEYKRAVTLNPADSTALDGFIKAVRECVALRPVFDNYLMLGGAYVLAHDFEHAKQCYEQCFRLDPRRTELQPARKAYHKAVATWPTSSDELVMDSLTKTQKFLEAEPEDAFWWYVLGRLKHRLHDNDGAMEAFRRAEKINPLIDPDLEREIGLLGGAPNSPLIASSAVQPGSSSPIGNGGTAPAAGSGQPAPKQTATTPTGSPTAAQPNGQPAAPVAQAPPAVNPANEALYRHIEQIATSNPDAASDELNQHLAKNPADGKAYVIKGMIEQKKGDYEDAAVDFRMADGFKQPGAKELLEQVNTIRVQDNVKQAEEAVKKGDITQAVQLYQDAIIKAPELPFLHKQLAPLLRQMHDDKGAEREDKKAKELETAK
jgi:tetratricopeptide (TPR) repeat protein